MAAAAAAKPLSCKSLYLMVTQPSTIRVLVLHMTRTRINGFVTERLFVCSMFMKLDTGLIYFLLHKSSQLIEAYHEAKKIVVSWFLRYEFQQLCHLKGLQLVAVECRVFNDSILADMLLNTVCLTTVSLQICC